MIFQLRASRRCAACPRPPDLSYPRTPNRRRMCPLPGMYHRRDHHTCPIRAVFEHVADVRPPTHRCAGLGEAQAAASSLAPRRRAGRGHPGRIERLAVVPRPAGRPAMPEPLAARLRRPRRRVRAPPGPSARRDPRVLAAPRPRARGARVRPTLGMPISGWGMSELNAWPPPAVRPLQLGTVGRAAGRRDQADADGRGAGAGPLRLRAIAHGDRTARHRRRWMAPYATRRSTTMCSRHHRRKKEITSTRPARTVPAYIEAHLSRHPAHRQAFWTRRPDYKWRSCLVQMEPRPSRGAAVSRDARRCRLPELERDRDAVDNANARLSGWSRSIERDPVRRFAARAATDHAHD